jgi:hypothetical protein
MSLVFCGGCGVGEVDFWIFFDFSISYNLQLMGKNNSKTNKVVKVVFPNFHVFQWGNEF